MSIFIGLLLAFQTVLSAGDASAVGTSQVSTNPSVPPISADVFGVPSMSVQVITALVNFKYPPTKFVLILT